MNMIGKIGAVSLMMGALALSSYAQPEKEQVVLRFLQPAHLYWLMEKQNLLGTEAEIEKKINERLPSVVEKLRSENPEGTIVINTSAVSEQDFPKEEVDILKNPKFLAMKALGADIWVPNGHGNSLLVEDFNFVKKIADNLKSEVLMGLYTPEGETIFKPYTIVERSGVRIAIVGMVEAIYSFHGYHKGEEGGPLNKRMSAPDMAELAKEVDLVIMVVHDDPAHCVASDFSYLEKRYPQLAVIFMAHGKQYSESFKAFLESEGDTIESWEATRKGTIPVFKSSWDGTRFPMVDITLTKEGQRWVIADRQKDIQAHEITLKRKKPKSKPERE